MVLAKKGDRYKVVHGGYVGMKDYTQHRDKKRRERFWQRMGPRPLLAPLLAQKIWHLVVLN